MAKYILLIEMHLHLQAEVKTGSYKQKTKSNFAAQFGPHVGSQLGIN